MLKFVSLRRNKTHSYDITSRNSNNPLLICRAFHPRTSHSITNTMYRASHHLCEVENYSQLYKKEEWLADSPTVISLQRWGWMPEGQTVSSLLSLPRRAVLMPWLILGADFLAVWQGTWKAAWKKKINKQVTGYRRKMLVCFIVLLWPGGRNHLSCGSCERTTGCPLSSLHIVHFTEALQWKRMTYSTSDD